MVRIGNHMYHNKKIGVFVSHIMGFYQKNVCQGVVDKALEYGYATEIFVSMDGENLGEYGNGEENIINIPSYGEFSGVIFVSGTYVQQDLKDKLYSTLKNKCRCPVVEIANTNLRYPAVSLDNHSTIFPLIKHLVKEHGYKRICYMGCAAETDLSDDRRARYIQAMNHFDLSVGEKDTYDCSYTADSVREALSFFMSANPKPDAIVSYNDRLSLLLLIEAEKAGFKIPEDFAVTGFDNTEEGQNASPALTTISFPVYELGIAAVEKLVNIINSAGDHDIPPLTFVTSDLIIGESCGCHEKKEKNTFVYNHSLSGHINMIENSIIESMRMSAAFQNILDIDDGMDMLADYVSAIEGCREFYLVLYSGWDSISQHILDLTDTDDDQDIKPDEMLLKLAIRDGKRLAECHFKKKYLLPEHICSQSDAAYLYTPLYFGGRSFGYTALAFENNRIDYRFQLIHWFLNVNQMLARICGARETSILVTHLEDIYTKDALTGLHNKHGYLRLEEILLHEAAANKSTVTCFVFDMDNLKYINDNFGHSEGDFAIQVIGHALSGSVRPNDVCARFSGDEFYVLTAEYTKEDADDLIVRVLKYLSNYNKLSNKEYDVYASGGYAQAKAHRNFGKEDVKALFNKADELMYKQKEQHRLARI